jgi:hypothetical protein
VIPQQTAVAATITDATASSGSFSFAAINAARPAEHLIKELVQNAFDSLVKGQPGRIGHALTRQSCYS